MRAPKKMHTYVELNFVLERAWRRERAHAEAFSERCERI